MLARGLLYGLVIGAGAMYLLDPERGAARRAGLRARTRELASSTREVLASSEDALFEDVLVERVRSRLERVTRHANAIEVRCKEGNEIELKGPALASEHDRIVRAASRVRGVEAIDDDLVVYEDADGVPALEEVERAPSAGAPRDLLIGASVAALLVTPLAPMLLKAVLFAAVRTLLHEAGPEVMRRVAEGVSGAQRVGGDGAGARREARHQSEWGSQPT
jgi:hypothetical protein